MEIQQADRLPERLLTGNFRQREQEFAKDTGDASTAGRPGDHFQFDFLFVPDHGDFDRLPRFEFPERGVKILQVIHLVLSQFDDTIPGLQSPLLCGTSWRGSSDTVPGLIG